MKTKDMNSEIRFAKETELEEINKLRKQVNDLHVKGKPEIFKAGFSEELKNYVYDVFYNERNKIVVCDCDGIIAGFAILNHISKPESPFSYARDFLDIDEFCVDVHYRRQGIATRMIQYIQDYAKNEGFDRIELNMWEFNQEALAFYESIGFTTYRRFMEIKL